MDEYIIAAIASLAIMVLSMMSIAWSYRKFYPGEIKTVLGWVLIVLYVLSIPYIGFIVRDAGLLPQFEREINYFIYFSTMVAALLLARASWNLYKFTKIFSFKDLETSMREKTSQIKSRENKK
ncbi:MAG: hypothetical protein A7316_09535 [Candidatus Altiarchaeales archaeon WOR_SM1_86-2]|nr:MAG: hypothetical protein A7316_09535 [Candidatus Altiarchaeales archaeon WOR_SM1_86-2]ODS41410.1 MAG: hypothetical protein A7315_15230 [Candidatus Altiarchaeales archaeon WOR_SM1_79]